MLSITSTKQKANMRSTSSLPYIADRVTHSWVKGSRLSHKIPEKGLSCIWLPFLSWTLPGGLTLELPSLVPLLTLLAPDLCEKLL